MRRTVLLGVLLLVAAAGCGWNPNASSSVTDRQADMRTAPVVAKVRFRDHVLVIRTGVGELRYDVETRSGALLATSLTRTQLDRQFPAIAGQFRDSTAIQIDASLD